MFILKYITAQVVVADEVVVLEISVSVMNFILAMPVMLNYVHRCVTI